MTAPAWLCVPGGPSHCGPSLPYTAALGTWHRYRQHSGPPARLLQGEACLCPAKRFPDTTEPMQAAASSQPGPSWWQTEHSNPRAQAATTAPPLHLLLLHGPATASLRNDHNQHNSSSLQLKATNQMAMLLLTSVMLEEDLHDPCESWNICRKKFQFKKKKMFTAKRNSVARPLYFPSQKS